MLIYQDAAYLVHYPSVYSTRIRASGIRVFSPIPNTQLPNHRSSWILPLVRSKNLLFPNSPPPQIIQNPLKDGGKNALHAEKHA